jgi:hypothetical protein
MTAYFFLAVFFSSVFTYSDTYLSFDAVLHFWIRFALLRVCPIQMPAFYTMIGFHSNYTNNAVDCTIIYAFPSSRLCALSSKRPG